MPSKAIKVKLDANIDFILTLNLNNYKFYFKDILPLINLDY